MPEFPVIVTGNDAMRQVRADHADLMTVALRFAKAGAGGALNSHHHVQSTYVQSGQFRFSIDLNMAPFYDAPFEMLQPLNPTTRNVICPLT